jgi:protocatechuate 3,4-dioxygenase beta subunit
MKRRARAPEIPADPVRRAVLGALVGIPAAGLAVYAARSLTAAGTAFELAPTLACGDDDDADPTPSQTEGPYFTPNSPERMSLLERGANGTRLVVSGRVLSTFCDPMAGALLDFWQADADGEYDNRGYRLRGHQYTDGEGRFRLETIVPGVYTGRTRHIHVKVQARGGRVLTTQLYFPNEPQNSRDRIYSPKLLMDVAGDGGAQHGSFNFVLRT